MEIHQFDLTGMPSVHVPGKDDELKLGVHFYDLSYLYLAGEGLPASTLSAECVLDANTSGAIAAGAAFAGPARRTLVRLDVPAGEPMPRLHGTSGVMEIYFHKYF